MGGDSGGRLHAFRSLAGNRTLVRILGRYALFVLTEYSVWIAMLVYAYSRGGATAAAYAANGTPSAIATAVAPIAAACTR